MNATEILDYASHHDIHLMVESDALLVDGPKGTITPEFRGALKAHKAELLEVLAQQPLPDWNDHPDTPPTDPFTREAIQDIKGGKAVPVWSSVLEEWLWFVRDNDAQQQLVAQGCQSPIYTLGELAVVADMRMNSSFGPEDLKRVHAIKKKFGAAIEWPPKEAP